MKYNAYFALEKRLVKAGFTADRSDLILSFTRGRTASLRELSPSQYKAFLQWVKARFHLEQEQWQQRPENQMRRKIYALFVHHMGYTREGLEHWCTQYGKYHKGLNAHTYNELVDLVTQAEQVYTSFTKVLSK